jgi:hypothetical protein
MTIKYSDGSSKEAKVLALAGNILRVAIENGDDAVEFRLLNGRWFSEMLDEVYFEFELASEAREKMLSDALPEPQKQAG